MSGFGAIGEFAVGEFESGGVEIFVPARPIVIGLAAPAVAGGALVEAPAEPIEVGLAAPIVSTSARADVPAQPIEIGLRAPAVAGGALAEVPALPIAIGTAAPRVYAGAFVSVPAAPIQIGIRDPHLIEAGASVLCPAGPAIQIGLRAPFSNVVGALIEVGNTVSVETGEAIGETAIGEKAGEAEFLVGPPRIQLMRRRPSVAGGAAIYPPALPIHIGARAPDIGARTKPVRVQAIAS